MTNDQMRKLAIVVSISGVLLAVNEIFHFITGMYLEIFGDFALAAANVLFNEYFLLVFSIARIVFFSSIGLFLYHISKRFQK